MTQFSLDFPYAHGKPQTRAHFRSEPEDFIVDENLGFELAGQGEHLGVQLTKRLANTAQVANGLAQHFGVKPMDVGYCGLKDRIAVTTQWFSVYLPGQDGEIDRDALAGNLPAGTQVLQCVRHRAKLRRGQHRGNGFIVCLRDIDVEAVTERLQCLKNQGAPNYFGEQRFGNDASNLVAFAEWLETERSRDGRRRRLPRHKKGLLLSAARSYLFNTVLAERVTDDSWYSAVDGDVDSDGYPTGPLWGRGRTATTGAAAELERRILEPWTDWRDKLEHSGLSQARRSLVMKPVDLEWHIIEEQTRNVKIRFELPPGQYATAVLREIAVLETARRPL